jgi:hypothetical protein
MFCLAERNIGRSVELVQLLFNCVEARPSRLSIKVANVERFDLQ